MKYKRICIYPKDVQLITGKSERYGRKLLQRIRDTYAKKAHQFISVAEFCNYTGLTEQEVEQFLLG